MSAVTNLYKTTPNCTRGTPCRLCRARITFLQRNPRALAISQTNPSLDSKAPGRRPRCKALPKPSPSFAHVPCSSSSLLAPPARRRRRRPHRRRHKAPWSRGVGNPASSLLNTVRACLFALPLFLCFPCSCTRRTRVFQADHADVGLKIGSICSLGLVVCVPRVRRGSSFHELV